MNQQLEQTLKTLKRSDIRNNKKSLAIKISSVFDFYYFYSRLSGVVETIKDNEKAEIIFNSDCLGFHIRYIDSDGDDLVYYWASLRDANILTNNRYYNKIIGHSFPLSKSDILKLYGDLDRYIDDINENDLLYLDIEYDTVFKQISSISIKLCEFYRVKFEVVIYRCLHLLHYNKEPMYDSILKLKRLNLDFDDFEYIQYAEDSNYPIEDFGIRTIRNTNLYNLVYQYSRVINRPMSFDYFNHIFDIINKYIPLFTDDYLIHIIPFTIRELLEEAVNDSIRYVSILPISYSILRIKNDDFLENSIGKLWTNNPNNDPTTNDIIIANCNVALYKLDSGGALYPFKKGNYNFTISALLNYLHCTYNPHIEDRLDYLGRTIGIFRENFRF